MRFKIFLRSLEERVEREQYLDSNEFRLLQMISKSNIEQCDSKWCLYQVGECDPKKGKYVSVPDGVFLAFKNKEQSVAVLLDGFGPSVKNSGGPVDCWKLITFNWAYTVTLLLLPRRFV